VIELRAVVLATKGRLVKFGETVATLGKILVSKKWLWPGRAPWYRWEEDVGVELELEKILVVHINFEEYARAGIVDSRFFQSYLKMEEDLVSNLMKKIDDGKSNIKMN